jgi:hypothetical protein
MNFQKFVHRSTKGLFLFIAIMMIVPLVLWGYMGKVDSDKEGQEQAGVIKINELPVAITKTAFSQQKMRAYPAYYWRTVKRNPRAAMFALRGMMRMPEAKTEEIVKLAWRNIVLLEDARSRGIPAATDAESRRKFQEVWQIFGMMQIPSTDESIASIAQTIFHCNVPTFEAWISDLVVIDKLLSLVSGSEFAEYDKVYDRVMTGQQSVRATVAGFDPTEFVRELKPPRTEEIAKYYQDNKAKFKTPEKVRIQYLMADFDEIKKKAPEPTEDEVKKYYQDHKNEFTKPVEHKHGPGEEHKEDEKLPQAEAKPLEEVRGDIPDKIKRKWAEERAQEVISAANTDLGQAYVANNNKYPETIFDDLKKKYLAAKGIDLIHDNTSLFDRKRVDEIEKTLGAGGGLDAWAFDGKRAEGDISQVMTTTKGKLLVKLQQKKAADENPGVTAQNRDAIVKELQKEQLRKRAQAQASTVVEEIKSHGIAAARVKYPVEWRSTRYFSTELNVRGGGSDTGIEDRALGQAIQSRVTQGKPKAGEAMVLQGSVVGREKADWAYVVYVDDVVMTPPEDFEAKFQELRRQMDDEARERYQEVYASQKVFQAEVRDTLTKPDGTGTPISAPASPFDDDH